MNDHQEITSSEIDQHELLILQNFDLIKIQSVVYVHMLDQPRPEMNSVSHRAGVNITIPFLHSMKQEYRDAGQVNEKNGVNYTAYKGVEQI